MLCPLHKDSFIVKYLGDVNKFSSFIQPSLIYLFCILMFLFFLCRKNKFLSDNVLLTCILFVTVLVSFTVTLITKASLNGFFAVFYMPLFYFFLLENSKYNYFSGKERDSMTIVLFIWCIFPIIDSFYNNNWLSYSALTLDLKSNDFSFSGYALHRNVYGLYCTLSALLILFSRYSKLVRVVLYSAILSAIIMSQSRTALLIVLSFTFIHFWIILPKFRLILSIFGSLFSICIFTLLKYAKDWGMRNMLESDDSRIYIIKKLLSKYYNNLLFGSGETSYIDIGAEVEATAHNFIFQTLLDYGIFNLLIFLLIIWQLVIKFSYHSGMLFLTIIVYGLTQPYFSFGIPNIYMFFTFSLSIMFSTGIMKSQDNQLSNI